MQAFKNYDEAGVARRVQCLKYLVLANMLMNSDINPFDSQASPERFVQRGVLALMLVRVCVKVWVGILGR